MTVSWYGVNTFRLQAWTAGGGGSALHTYKPSLLTGGLIQFGEPDIVQEEIELVDYSRADYVRGYYPTINVSLHISGGTWTGTATTGPDVLETVMSHYWAGDWLKLSLDDGATYIWVRVESDSGSVKSEGKNVALTRDIVFKGTVLKTADFVANGGGAL